MRLLLVASLLVSLASMARADDTPTGVGASSLPPGLWFRARGYEAHALDTQPPTPHVVAIAGEHTRASAAERTARRVDRRRVGLGYPWLVANHDLELEGVCHDEIVVVVGLFASLDDARAWQASDATRAGFHLVGLADDTSECTWSEDGLRGLVDDAGRHFDVIHVEPTRDAPAYRARDVARLDSASSPEERARIEAALVPTCTIRRGSVFSFDTQHARFRFGYRYAPARCDGETVYVPVEHTLRGTVFETTGNETRILQITDVMCDSPCIDAWTYTIEGRREIEGSPPLFTAPCAG